MNLIESLQLKPVEIISLVGGGGKTTLMFALAHELAAAGHKVITTTTTRIYRPSADESPCTILLENQKEIEECLRRELERHRHLTLAQASLPEDKLQGASPDFVLVMAGWELAPYIIVEADGAKHRPLKAPKAGEPVFPKKTTLIIPVIGIEVLNGILNEERVFRPEIASRLLGLPLNSPISAGMAADLLTHPMGMLKGSPPQARIIPFINKIDLEKNLRRGEELAKSILGRHPSIERVLIGQANSPTDPVRAIVRN